MKSPAPWFAAALLALAACSSSASTSTEDADGGAPAVGSPGPDAAATADGNVAGDDQADAQSDAGAGDGDGGSHRGDGGGVVFDAAGHDAADAGPLDSGTTVWACYGQYEDWFCDPHVSPSWRSVVQCPGVNDSGLTGWTCNATADGVGTYADTGNKGLTSASFPCAASSACANWHQNQFYAGKATHSCSTAGDCIDFKTPACIPSTGSPTGGWCQPD